MIPQNWLCGVTFTILSAGPRPAPLLTPVPDFFGALVTAVELVDATCSNEEPEDQMSHLPWFPPRAVNTRSCGWNAACITVFTLKAETKGLSSALTSAAL